MKRRIATCLVSAALFVVASLGPVLAEGIQRDNVEILTAKIDSVWNCTLRITVYGSAGTEPEQPEDPFFVRLCDERGRTLAESERAVIPRGGFHSFDFPYEVLPPERQEPNGRQQVLIKVYTCPDDSAPPAIDASATVELFETRSGSTVVASHYRISMD